MTVARLSPALRQVHQAALNRDPERRAANQDLVDAIVNARNTDPPHTLQEIADVLDVTRQAVFALLQRRT